MIIVLLKLADAQPPPNEVSRDRQGIGIGHSGYDGTTFNPKMAIELLYVTACRSSLAMDSENEGQILVDSNENNLVCTTNDVLYYRQRSRPALLRRFQLR
jgi:hypothetical protein